VTSLGAAKALARTMFNATLSTADLPRAVASAIRSRDAVIRTFFANCARELGDAARAIEERLSRNGRIYCFGRGVYSLDAAEFAAGLPASDVSLFRDAFMPLVRAEDVVVAFGPPRGDAAIERATFRAKTLGVYTLAFSGKHADLNIPPIAEDEHLHEESIAIAAHLVAETVGVFRKRRAEKERASGVTVSILQRAADAEALRDIVAAREAESIAGAIELIVRSIAAGGRLLLVAREESATGAARWAWDSVAPPDGLRAFPALTVPAKPDALAAQIRPHDVAIGISTRAASRELIGLLDAARRGGNQTIALLGGDGGDVRQRDVAQRTIVVPSSSLHRVAEVQTTVYHTIRHAVRWLQNE